MTPYALLACNNAWSNEALIAACLELAPEEREAPRTSFFPSILATIEHIHAVGLYDLDAATEGGMGARADRASPRFVTSEALAPAQRALDLRLVAVCDGLREADLARHVPTDRGAKGVFPERLGLILLHLLQHQVHHGGQMRAMLSGSSVAPPPLDEFFLDYGRAPSAEGRL